MTDRGPFAAYRAKLAAKGFRPRRRFGQNFLLEPSLHRWIAERAELGQDDVALEVGPGLGFLTRELALRCRRVVAVEIDERLHAIAIEERAEWVNGDRVELLRADALRGGHWNPDVLTAVAAARAGRGVLRLVANLPYAVTGPLLGELVTLPEPPEGGVVLIQADVAERLVAAPGTADFGGLTALFGAGYSARVVRRVGRDVFWPRPNVESAILAFDRRPQAPLWRESVAGRGEFGRFVRALFGHRRKQLGNVLPAALASVGRGLPAELPAETLSRRASELAPDASFRIWAGAAGLP